jgi:hypothetical protein
MKRNGKAARKSNGPRKPAITCNSTTQSGAQIPTATAKQTTLKVTMADAIFRVLIKET